MKEMLDQIIEEIPILKCFGARLRKEGIKFWNYLLARQEEDRTSSVNAVPRKSAGLFKCWTCNWLACWIQAWIWMEDLPQEYNVKWKLYDIPPCSSFMSYFSLGSKLVNEAPSMSVYSSVVMSCPLF